MQSNLELAANAAGMGHNGGPPLVEDSLSLPQYQLVSSNKRFPAMVAGFGSGKTEALVKRALRLKFEFWEQSVGYYLPTYDLVKTIAIPRITEVLTRWGYIEGVHYRLNKSDSWFDFALSGGGKIIMRTMDRPERIVGYEVADSCVDELDTLKQEAASASWKKIIARNRQKKPRAANGALSSNSVAVGTTPEGFRFVYETWKKSPPSNQYQLIKASTYSNRRNLPVNYIDDLKDAYPSQLVEAYINGEFVNLTSGAVYPNFDRVANASFEAKRSVNSNGKVVPEALHFGLDFNVGKMAGVGHVFRQGVAHAIIELVDLLDTPAFIEAVKERYQSKGHKIYIYPDASGDARKTLRASETDLDLLTLAGFEVIAEERNPFVRDRILSFNRALERKQYMVNVDACPNLAAALEQQVYDKNGAPDKSAGKDHINDAAGYFVITKFPIIKPSHSFIQIGGL